MDSFPYNSENPLKKTILKEMKLIWLSHLQREEEGGKAYRRLLNR